MPPGDDGRAAGLYMIANALDRMSRCEAARTPSSTPAAEPQCSHSERLRPLASYFLDAKAHFIDFGKRHQSLEWPPRPFNYSSAILPLPTIILIAGSVGASQYRCPRLRQCPFRSPRPTFSCCAAKPRWRPRASSVISTFLRIAAARLKGFDPTRGSLGAFAGKVIAHRAARLTDRLRRERAVFTPVSLDHPLADAEDATLGDTMTESNGYSAMMGQSTDSFADLERRHDLDRALGTLRRSDLALCATLVHHTPTELSQDGLGSRATLYRQVHELRLRLMTGGLSDAA